jgi:hypothetical protein
MGFLCVFRDFSTDFRFYMRENYPSILDGYYKIGETLDSNNRIRIVDEEIWSKKN